MSVFFVDQGRFLVSHAYRDWKPFPSQRDDLGMRLDADLPPNKTHMAMYGIYRCEAWQKIFSRAYVVQFSYAYVYERLLNLQRTTLGKTEIIESLLWLRSKENAPVIHSDIPRTLGRDFVSWATLSEFVDEALEYKKSCPKHPHRGRTQSSARDRSSASLFQWRRRTPVSKRKKLEEEAFTKNRQSSNQLFASTNSALLQPAHTDSLSAVYRVGMP